MKPGPGDKKLQILIAGDELQELQNISWALTECFGLDRRIENYAGKRPIGLYAWDFECIDAAIENALKMAPDRSEVSPTGAEILARLASRLRDEYRVSFGDDRV